VTDDSSNKPTAQEFQNGQPVGSIKRRGKRRCSWRTATSHCGPPQRPWRPNRALPYGRLTYISTTCGHEAGSRMLEAGWPLHHVQRMLGTPT
jgi:hypothetical protein